MAGKGDEMMNYLLFIKGRISGLEQMIQVRVTGGFPCLNILTFNSPFPLPSFPRYEFRISIRSTGVVAWIICTANDILHRPVVNSTNSHHHAKQWYESRRWGLPLQNCDIRTPVKQNCYFRVPRSSSKSPETLKEYQIKIAIHRFESQ